MLLLSHLNQQIPMLLPCLESKVPLCSQLTKNATARICLRAKDKIYHPVAYISIHPCITFTVIFTRRKMLCDSV